MKPFFCFFMGLGGMLTSLSTCSRHVCFKNFRVGQGDVNVPVNLLTSCMLRELRGWARVDVNVPVSLLTSCMLWRHSLTEKKSLAPLQFLKHVARACNAR